MLRPWFLQPKVKIIPPERTPDGSESGRGTLPDDLVADLPWVSEFDLFDPAQMVRVHLILRVSRVKGQTFSVISATDVQQRKALATFTSFPTSDEVSAAVSEPFAAARMASGVPNPARSSSGPSMCRDRLRGPQRNPGSKIALPI